MKKKFALIASALTLSLAAGCGTNSSSSTEDSSTSGSVAASIGGGVNGSSSSGTMAKAMSRGPLDTLLSWLTPEALASGSCPTIATSTFGIEQLYSNCSFSGSSAVWNGGVTFSGSLSNVTRLIANGTTRTATTGTVVTINTSGSSLTPFNGDTAPSGGSTWTSSSLAIGGVNFVAKNSSGTTLFNHVVTTSSSDGGSTLTISGTSVTGTAITYHQLARVKATSTINVTLSSDCCLPTGGTITTSFNASDAKATQKYNGVTETLSFTGCGTATYTGPEGYSGTVSLNHCL